MKDIVSLVEKKRSERISNKEKANRAYKAKWDALERDAEDLFTAFYESVKNIHKLGYSVGYNPKVPVWKRTLTIDKNGRVLCIVLATTDYGREYASDGFISPYEGEQWAILELRFKKDDYPHRSLDRGWPAEKIKHLLEAIAEKIDD